MFRQYFRRHRLLALLIGLAVLFFAVSVVRLSGVAADDSFIHRRIALNYQQTGKPYFNLDQRVMVTSSPLWTQMLALSGAVLPLANPVPCLEMAFILVGAAAGYLLLWERHRDQLSGLILPAIAFFFICVADLPSALDQMETPCAVALIMAGVLGVRKRRTWGVSLLVLASFARYECVLLCVLAVIWVSVRRRWTKWSLVSAAVTGVSGLAWLLWEYGTFIPNTVVAKSHLYVMTYRQVIRGFFSIPQALVCLIWGTIWWFYGRNRRYEHSGAAAMLVGFGVCLGMAYLVRKTYIFSWYQPLVLVPLSIGVLLWTNPQRVRTTAIGAVFAGAFLLPSAMTDMGLVSAALRGATGSIPDFPLVARVHAYRRIGAALNTECPTGILMTSEIGALGWAFHGEIRDGAGLASPEAIRYHPMRVPQERRSGSLGEIPAGFVRDYHPDLIVSYDLLAESALPAARSLGYLDYAYPLFVRGDRASATNLWEARQMHVLVAPDGRCSPTAVKSAVGAALEK
jgi:hypothetical protein